MMNFFEWFQKWNGQRINGYSAQGGQCMDAMHQYCIEVLGLERSDLQAITAQQAYINGSPKFLKIANRPWNVPVQGDIVFFGAPFGRYIDTVDHKIKYAGHVCIFNEGNVFRFTSIDQNDPMGSSVHVQSHGYGSCLGWLRKK